MKYLKTYETHKEINNIPSIGDYVIIKKTNKEEIFNFITTNIGKIVSVDIPFDEITVNYTDIPPEFEQYFILNYGKYGEKHYNRIFPISYIKYIAKTEEELQLKINVQKYNI